MIFDHVWRVRKWPTGSNRFGERCRVLCYGAMNQCMVEFENDRKRYVTLRWFVRRAA